MLLVISTDSYYDARIHEHKKGNVILFNSENKAELYNRPARLSRSFGMHET